MSFLATFLITALLLIEKVSAQYKKCDFYQALQPGVIYTISSPRFPANYLRGTECRWAAEAPPGYKISLACSDVRLPPSFLCNDRADRILVSRSGKVNLSDGRRHCGSVPFTETSFNDRMVVALKTSPYSRGGRFKCSLKAVGSNCNCGLMNRGKIVGGSETQINEYPSMAGVVDSVDRKIFCGATIISNTYALSAAHCGLIRPVDQIGLVVGEHDITKGNETPYTVLLRISAFKAHPQFNNRTNENDIALVRTATPIVFTRGVQPVCLPFKYRSESFLDRMVQALGWGATEFAGPLSNVLKQVTLTVVGNGSCTSNQICTFTRNKDSCQSDSGGPLLFIENNVNFHVGVVSFGTACASRFPSVNTRVTSYLDWILQNTESTTFCVR